MVNDNIICKQDKEQKLQCNKEQVQYLGTDIVTWVVQ